MRTFFSITAWLVFALLSHVGAAASQQEARIYRIGHLWIGTPAHVTIPFEKWTGSHGKTRDTLTDHGFMVGKFIVGVRHAYGDESRLAVEAKSLVSPVSN